MITGQDALHDSRAGFDHAGDGALGLIGCRSIFGVEDDHHVAASVQQAVVHGTGLCPRLAIRHDQDLKRPEVESGACLVVVLLDQQDDLKRGVVEGAHRGCKVRDH